MQQNKKNKSGIANWIQTKQAEKKQEEELRIRKLKLKQIMKLKARGRFLSETGSFVQDTGRLPSRNSQKRILKALNNNQEDKFDDLMKSAKNKSKVED